MPTDIIIHTAVIFLHSWYCHFDDDVYVNIKALHNLLSTLNPLDKHYLGKLSRDTALKVSNDVKNNFDDLVSPLHAIY